MNALRALLPPPAAEVVPVQPVRPRLPRRRSILLLDDNTKRGEIRAARLRMAGADVHYMRTADDALWLLQESPYDLVLIDMRNHLPEGHRFCFDVLRRNPAQRMAFYVDGPECISRTAPPVKTAIIPTGPRPTLDSVIRAGKAGTPRPGSLLDAGWRISVNRRLAGKRRTGEFPSPDAIARWSAK